MNRQAYARKLEALEALRLATDSATAREELRKALKDRGSYMVSKAAAIAAELKAEELLPELLAAFDRFFTDPVKSDPQCLAKNAIAKALKDLGHRGAQAYVRGMGHFQFEPAWGGRADTAGTLRSTCALALTACNLDDIEILTQLTDALADPEKLVRINSAIAIEQLGRPEGALLLRLKLLSGDQEPEVLGQSFTSLLSLAPDGGVSFISQSSQRRRPAGGSQRAGAVSRPARHPNPPGLLARAADLAPDSPRAADQSGRFPDAGGSRISSVCHHARVVRPRRERDCRAGNQPISRRDAGARRGRAPGEGQSSPAVDLRAEVRPQRA